MPRIFISYRRDDSLGYAGRLFDRLTDHFGKSNVFMDVDTIEPGIDFIDAVKDAVSSSDALIALIGRNWLTSTDFNGERRIDNLDDLVRLEIVTALERNIRVIPILLSGTSMPRLAELPDEIGSLARRNALELSDSRFHYDVGRLITVLDSSDEKTVPTDKPGDKHPEKPEAPPGPLTDLQFCLKCKKPVKVLAISGKRYCPECGDAIDKDIKNPLVDATSLSSVICPNCGSSSYVALVSGRYCDNCGAKFVN